MSTPLPTPLNWEDMGERLFVHANSTLVLLNTASAYPANSPFANLSAGQEKLERDTIRPTVISEAIASLTMSLVAATDSVHAMSCAMQRPGPMSTLGFALGSLTRSALESLARAYYLQNGPDQAEMLRRWMTLRISNMANAIEESALDLDRTAKDYATMRRLREAATALGMPKGQQTISFGRMTVDLLDAVLSDQAAVRPGTRLSGSVEYSFLSSLAHGESAGHAHMTTVISRGDGNFGLNQTTVGMTRTTWGRCVLLLLPSYMSVIGVYLMGCGVDDADIVAWQRDTVYAFELPPA